MNCRIIFVGLNAINALRLLYLVSARTTVMGQRTFAAAALLLVAGLVSSSLWAAAFSNGDLSISLPNDWELDSSDQYGTYFNSGEKAEQLVISSMAMKMAARSNSMKTLARGAEPKIDKKLVEVKGNSGSAVLRGLFPAQPVFFDIRIIAMSGKVHALSYYCYRCRTIDSDTIQRGEALLGAVKFRVPQ